MASTDAASPDDLDAAVSALYAAPLDEFVQARDALARTLRAAGRREEAASIRKLAKPKRLAWALDTAAHGEPDAIGRVVAAADALAGGGSGADVRQATADMRAAARTLAEAAGRLASAAGTPPSQAELVPAVLAVAADPEALAALAAGRLVDVPSGGAFGAVSVDPGAGRASDLGSGPRPGAARAAREPGGAGAAREPGASRTAQAAGAARAAPERGAGRRRASARELTAARRAVERAEAKAADARARAEQAAAGAERAETELDRAEQARLAAQREVEAAREHFAEARGSEREAVQAAREADAAADAARAELSELS